MRYLETVAEPALMDVTDELRKSGVEVEFERTEVDGLRVHALLFTAAFPDQQDFTYQVYPVAHDLPTYAYRRVGNLEHYYRLEVFTVTGSHGYDVYGFDSDQIISDVLGHYESHLEYLRLSSGGSDASIGESELVITDWSDDFEDPEKPV